MATQFVLVQASSCAVWFVRMTGKCRPREEATRRGSCVRVRVRVFVRAWRGVGGHCQKYFKCVVLALQHEMHRLHSFIILFFCDAFIDIYFVYFAVFCISFYFFSLPLLPGVKV